MYLRDIAKFIFVPGTASEDTQYCIRVHNTGAVLWHGAAKDLQNWERVNESWSVVEILINQADMRDIPDYNKGKIITVT